MNNYTQILLLFLLTTISGLTALSGNELSVSDKMLYYSGKNSEIYSSNFIGTENSSVSYAFTYSTGRFNYFAMILNDKNKTIKQVKIKDEYPLIEYKKYDDIIVVTAHINPSLNEYYIYSAANEALNSFYAGDLIIVDRKAVSVVYPPHFAADKKSVDIEVDGKEVLKLPFSYYSLEKAGANKVKISEYMNNAPKLDLDQTTIEADTSIVISI